MDLKRDAFFINGEWAKPSSDKRFEIINASTGKVIAHVPEAAEADVDAAVDAARKAFDQGEWPRMKPAERTAIMEAFAAEIARRSTDIAKAVSMQNGMPVTLSKMLEGQLSVSLVQYYAGLIDQDGEVDARPSQMGKVTFVEKIPLGVVAAIVPWNFPVMLALSKIAPAIAAGCTVVVKPSPGTVLDSYLLADSAQAAGVPAGVINWVAADREVGSYLVSHPGINKVAFTGSTGAGRQIASECGKLLRPATLELGGKSAAIVLEDANLESFLESAPMVSLLNNGQACYNCTRILAPKNRYDEVVGGLSALMSSLNIGDALDSGTQVGPMASKAHRDKVESYIAKGNSEARLVVGGGRPSGHEDGWFVEPTLFADVDNNDTIAREEIFGPVLSVISYDGDDDAIRIANDSNFGLGGSVWSRDDERALSVARQVASGTVGVNGYMPSLGSPFGGIKASGHGRELGPEAVGSYQQLKSIYVMDE